MKNTDTLLHEVTLKILQLQETCLFKQTVLVWRICPSPTFHFMEWRHGSMFSGLWVLNVDIWFMFWCSLSKEFVHFCVIKYFWIDLMWEKWLCNNGNYLHFMRRGNLSAFEREFPVALFVSSTVHNCSGMYPVGPLSFPSLIFPLPLKRLRMKESSSLCKFTWKWCVCFQLGSGRLLQKCRHQKRWHLWACSR